MNQNERARAIEAAAYKVLSEKGFKGASMLAIARVAKSSNETLYKWYGDKIGLFTAMIRSNTQSVLAELETVRQTDGDGRAALQQLGPALLSMVQGQRAVILNRAAASDISGTLGQALAQSGRETIAPMISQLLADRYGSEADIKTMSETYIALLIGDLQVRRVTGALAPLTADEISARADRALAQFERLYPL